MKSRTLILAAVAVLLAIAAPIAWNNGLRDRLIAKNFGQVEPGLYRSGQISHALIERTLQSHHIDTVIALSAEGAPPADEAAELRACENLNIHRELFPLSGDGTGSLDNYAAAVAAVDQAHRQGKIALVHCVAGAQRTGGVIAIYQLLVEHLSPQDAVAQMRRFGHDPSANPKLLEFLNAHMAEIAGRLVKLGVIEHVPDPIPQLPQ